MRFVLISTPILLLKAALFSCIEALVNDSLASNHGHGEFDIRDIIHNNCFHSSTEIVILSKYLQNESKLLDVLVNSTPSYLFGKEANTALKKYKRFRHVYKLEGIHAKQKLYPAGSITIFMHNDIDLSQLLESLQVSIWWNSKAKFLVVGFNDLNCQLAQKWLSILWSFNVISVVYLCQNSKNEWIFYAFNPYSYAAPSFWKSVEPDIQVGKKWALFHHVIELIDQSSASNSLSFCKNLYFDKLSNMQGYNLRAMVDEFLPYSKNETHYRRCLNPNLSVLCQALKSINLTYTAKFTHLTALINPNGQPSDNINEIISGKMDIGLTTMFARDYWWLQTYPYLRDDLKIITLFQSNYAISFFMIFKPSMWVFLALLVTFTILSLQYILKSSFALATLEFVRIFVSNATRREPTRNFEKQLFILLILLWFFINICIQSTFTADKITINKNKEIDSIEDLIDSNLTIRGFKSLSDILTSEKIRNPFIPDSPNPCRERLLAKENIACIVPGDSLKKLLPDTVFGRIHVSKNSLIERGIAWLFSEDSPILVKVNAILSRFYEAGIVDYWVKDNRFQYHGSDRINSAELVIAQRILIGGWILAVGVAIIEITIEIIKRL